MPRTSDPPLVLGRAAVAMADGGAPWPAELWRRFRHLFLLKLVGTTAYVWLFFLGYFELLNHPVHPITVMPLTPIDQWMPVVPQLLFAYLTLWFYVGIAPGLERTFWSLVVYGLWVGALLVAGLAIFYFWPTQVPPSGIDLSGYPGFKALQGVDAAGNACPSMHVAIALFSAVRTDDVLRDVGAPRWPRALNVAWFAAIAVSTMAVRQHVALDVLAGAALGLAFALPSLRWRPKYHSGSSIRDHRPRP